MNDEISDEWRKTPAKKNKRKWCKGKIGRLHVGETRLHKRGYGPPECRPAPEWIRRIRRIDWWCMHEIACTVCGKVLVGYIDPAQCPDRPKEES